MLRPTLSASFKGNLALLLIFMNFKPFITNFKLKFWKSSLQNASSSEILQLISHKKQAHIKH